MNIQFFKNVFFMGFNSIATNKKSFGDLRDITTLNKFWNDFFFPPSKFYFVGEPIRFINRSLYTSTNIKLFILKNSI